MKYKFAIKSLYSDKLYIKDDLFWKKYIFYTIIVAKKAKINLIKLKMDSQKRIPLLILNKNLIFFVLQLNYYW
jgi:hypothetical protein